MGIAAGKRIFAAEFEKSDDLTRDLAQAGDPVFRGEVADYDDTALRAPVRPHAALQDLGEENGQGHERDADLRQAWRRADGTSAHNAVGVAQR